MKYLSIKEWAADDQPREKMMNNGARSMSDVELIAILIGSGTREISAVELSRQLLSTANNSLSILAKKTLNDLTKIRGIGEAKAVSILAALELGRRSRNTDIAEKAQLTSSSEVFNYIHPMLADLSHEEFWVLYLNRSNRVIEKFKLSQGGISGTVIDVRLVLKRGLELLSSSIIVCHNHPSGNLQPSENDKQVTLKIKRAAEQLDISLLDHLIIAENSYLSFSDEALL